MGRKKNNENNFIHTNDETKKVIKRFVKHTWIYFFIALVISMGGMLIIDIINPPQPTSFTWNGILMFLVIAAGIGWIIHGTGFLIVKVGR